MRHVLLAAVVLAGFAPAPFPKPGKQGANSADLALLQGEWVATGGTLDRKKLDVEGYTVTVSGREITFFWRGQATARWTIKLDATKRPKRLDLCDPPDKEPVLNVYRLEGDVLTLSWRNDDNAKGRPINFEGGPGIGVTVYARKKP